MTEDLKKLNLYALTGRVADARQGLENCPVNSVSWTSIADVLQEAVDAAREIGRRVKNGEIR